MSNKGKTVKCHYKGTLDDGTQFDSSYDRGEPLEFVCAAGMMIPGFDAAVEDMKVGEKRTVHIAPEDAYGEYREDLLMDFPANEVPDLDQLHVGDKVFLQSPMGPMPAVITEITDEKVVVDLNHELAGKALNFDIELVEVADDDKDAE